MNSPEPNGRVHINKAMLLVCDPAGNVQAVTSNAAEEIFPDGLGERKFAEIFGRGSTLDDWLAERIEEAHNVSDTPIVADDRDVRRALPPAIEFLVLCAG